MKSSAASKLHLTKWTPAFSICDDNDCETANLDRKIAKLALMQQKALIEKELFKLGVEII